MATVYKIEIEATSEWVNYNPEQIQKMLTELIEKRKDFKDIEIKAERKAYQKILTELIDKTKDFKNIEIKVERKA